MNGQSVALGCAVIAMAAGVARAGELALGEIEDVEVLSLSELLEQPVVAASRYAQKPGDSPILVSTIDRDLIERFGYRTLGDALRGMRGMYVNSDRSYNYLGSRGFSTPDDYNTRFALSVDDHRLNDPTYGQANIGGELGLPMLAIDRVELVRGGAWSVHGQSALLGAIQVVTATGASRPGLHVTSTTRADVETFSDPADRPTFGPRGEDVAASYGAVTHGVDVFVAGSLDSDRGLSAIYLSELAGGEGPCVDAHGAPRACDGVVTGRDGEVAGGVYGSLRTEHWALHAFASRRRKQSPTAAYQTLIGDAIETFDTRLYLDGSYHRATEHTDVVARASVDYYGYHGNYPFAVPPQDGAGGALVRAVNFDLGKSMWVSGELRGRYHVERAGPYLSRLELASGLELARASATQLNEDRGQGAPVRYLDRTDPQESLALSLHASGRAFDHLVGFAAVRADDQPRSFGLSVNPQGGVVLDGGDLGRIRASFARGLRAPNVYEQFFTIRESALGVLGPEHSDTRELSVERYLGEHVRLLLVGYRQQVRDLITLTPAADGGAVYLNQGWVRSIGVEGELEGRWDALRLHATYARQRSTTSAQVLPNSPSALATLMVAAPLAGGRGEVGVESWFIHHRQSFDGTAIAPQFMTDVVLTVHRVVGDVDASLGIANVFDQRGGDPGGEEFLEKTIPHDPRTVWLRLSVAVQP